MNKAKLAILGGVVLLLTFSTLAMASENLDGYRDSYGNCCCPGCCDCSCFNPYPNFQEPWEECILSSVLNGLRAEDAYYGEDDDYIYFHASEDPVTDVFEKDEEGSALMGISLDHLEDWVDLGCPTNE